MTDEGIPIRHDKILSQPEHIAMIGDALSYEKEAIEHRYAAPIVQTTEALFQQWFEDPKHPCATHGCENAKYLRKKWVKVKDVDLVGYIWLKDFNNGVPLDPRFEVYGGKLEFAAYNFSLIPQRGTLVLFPAGPHFITAISPVLVGSYEHVKVGIKLSNDGALWLYQPEHFPGTYQDWFVEH